jgi:hypothetical protein
MERETKEDGLRLPVDLHVEMFRNTLQDPRVQAWRQKHRNWQLHISGGPGSGKVSQTSDLCIFHNVKKLQIVADALYLKTTLASLLAEQLQRESTSLVALVHVHDEEPTLSLRDTAIPQNRTIISTRYINHDKSLTAEAINISSSSTDLEDLCMVLANQLSKSDGVHLIIDGYDRIQKSVREELQQNMRLLEAQGLRVLILSAVSELEAFPPPWSVICDSCKSGIEESGGLHIYWSCDLCPYDLCDTCKAEGKHCRGNDHAMSEPYDMVNMRLTSVPSELRRFVRADLEAEYGSGIDENVIEAICEPSDGNVNLAKLRLDQIRDLGAPSDILAASDRLPREVVAFFDIEIKRINVLEPAQKYQTLLAIIAVATAGWMSVSELEKLLSDASSSGSDLNGGDYPHVRRVLESARGLLSSIIFNGSIAPDQEESDRHKVALYIRDLGWYVREDYNQDLVLAKQYLSQARTGVRNLDRSHSFEKAVGARSEEANGSGVASLREPSAKYRLSEVSGRSIIDAILREPRDVCTLCQQSIFRCRPNSGVRTWSDREQKNRCPICLYAYKEMDRRLVHAYNFHWARRTMGRTTNANNHLALTLRASDLSAETTSRRFVFMLRSELGPLSELNDPGKTTALEYTGQQIRKWMHTCKTEHVLCNHHTMKPYIPKRLIDIDTGTKGHYRVIPREQKAKGPYVTLSHSWGPNPDFLTLTTKDKNRLMTKGFSVSELKNKNFEEAIEVARHLKVKYIWIDSLCICQAGKDKDFKVEGQYMHLVYQNSYCNIVAADSKNAGGGLFRDRSEKSLSDTNTKGSWIVLDKELWAKDLLQSPIYTRGWVFQGKHTSLSDEQMLKSQRENAFSSYHSLHTFPGFLGL